MKIGSFIKALPVLALAVMTVSCKNNKDGKTGSFPENFSSMSDTEKVSYLMRTTTPDSVARFIIYASLDEKGEHHLDSLGVVTNYVYSTYPSDKQVAFGEEYDKTVDKLPLAKRMKLYAMAGEENPQGLGYELGLSYIALIRDKNMKVGDVEKEISEFKKACGEDTATYRRFIVGFKTALEYDRGKDISKDIYERFKNLSE